MPSDPVTDTKQCPRCAETIKRAANLCRYCGTDLQAYAITNEAAVETMLFDGHPAIVYSAWQWIAIVLSLGLAYLYYGTQSIALRYQVSTQRVKIERGIVTKIKESVELFSVDHFEVIKPLGMQLAGHCILRLRSSDESCRTVLLYGIADLESLAETLRECSLRERTRRRVVAVMPT